MPEVSGTIRQTSSGLGDGPVLCPSKVWDTPCPASSLATLMLSILGEDAGRASPEPWSGSLEWSQVAKAFCALSPPVQCGRSRQGGGGARVHLDRSPSRQEVMPPGLISAAVACLAWFRQTGRCPQGDLPDSESLGTEVFTPWGGRGRQGQDTSC